MTKTLFDDHMLGQLEGHHRLFIGFSGGLDSTVLLHACLSTPQLKNKLVAIHVNHGLSPNANDWQQHCQDFCTKHSIPFISHSIKLEKMANIEERARTARYEIFSSHLGSDDGLLLGHHQDDQAETMLLQLFRGAGIDGLSAMPFSAPLAKGIAYRPLLDFSKKTLEAYADEQQLNWVEDESNQQLDYSRNYIRHALLPIIEKNWPAAVQSLARSADHCQQARQNLQELAELDAQTMSLSQPVLALNKIIGLNKNRISNLLRTWLKNNEVRMPSSLTFERLINEVILSREDAQPLLQWGGIQIRRYQQRLYLLKDETQPLVKTIVWSDFPEPLILNGVGQLVAARGNKGISLLPGSKIEIKFRHGGEIFYWHGQSKELKKLFQQWKVPPWLRERIPLLYVDDKLAMVVGFAISDHYYSESAQEAWSISLDGF